MYSIEKNYINKEKNPTGKNQFNFDLKMNLNNFMKSKISKTFYYIKYFLFGNNFFLKENLKILNFLLIIFLFKKKNFFSQTIFNLFSNCILSRKANQNININNCLIMFFNTTENGGVIYIDSTQYLININDTTFYQCVSSNGFGGALYFNDIFNFQLLRICALYCTSNNYYQFAFIRSNNNHILDLITLYDCSNIYGHITIGFLFGYQNISNINISYNENIEKSGFYSYYPNLMFCNYCTFYNNTVSSYICISLLGGKGHISKSNIILNYSPPNGVIYVENFGNYNFYECIFDLNKNNLFYVDSGSLQLNNCFINHLYINIITDIGIEPIFSPTLMITNTNYYLYYIYSTYYCSYNNINPTVSNSFNPIFNTTFSTDCLIFSKYHNHKSVFFIPIYVSCTFFFI